MGMQAAGAYLKALRNSKRWSQERLAGHIGVTGNTIYRIEAGTQEPGATTLSQLLAVLGGRMEDIRSLLDDAAATRAMGEALATAALTQAEQQQVAQMTADEEAALLREIREAPEFIPALRAALRAMRGRDTTQ